MGIYIKGIEMPSGLAERGFVIRGDGRVRTFSGVVIDYVTAIPVPLHGRLVDADKMIWRLTPNEEFYPTEEDRFDYDSGKLMVRDIRGFIRDQETIIPASEEGE